MRALYFRPVLQIATRPDTTAKRGRVLRIVMAAALRARAGVAKLASSWRISFSFSSQSTRFASAGGLASNRASARASAAAADRLLEAWVETAFSIAALQFLGSGDGSPVMITYFAQRSPRAVAANRCICSSCASRTLSGRATVSRPSVDEPGRNALQLPFNAAAARDAVRTCPEKAIIDVPPALGPMPPGRCGTPMTTSPVAVLRCPWLAIGLPHPGSSDGRNPIKYKSMQLSDDFAVTSVWPVGAARRHQILPRRHAGFAPVFTAELAGAAIPDVEGDGVDRGAPGPHQALCLRPADVLDVVQRRGHRPRNRAGAGNLAHAAAKRRTGRRRKQTTTAGPRLSWVSVR